MIYKNFFLFLCAVSMGHLMRHISALSAEGIANAKLGNQRNFIYQAAIFGKEGYDEVSELLCSGAIVAASWILSVAHCVMLYNFQVKNLIFTAVVGFTDFNDPDAMLHNIVYVYSYGYEYTTKGTDILMAKTEKNMTVRSTIQPIATPNGNRFYFEYKTGLVSGYGISEVTRANGPGRHNFVHAQSQLKLRYTRVKLVPSSKCSKRFPDIHDSYRMCGLAERNNGQYTGICPNDVGSPLVFEGQVVALASTSNPNCDDTRFGSLYMETTPFFEFIENAKKDIIIPYMYNISTRPNKA